MRLRSEPTMPSGEDLSRVAVATLASRGEAALRPGVDASEIEKN